MAGLLGVETSFAKRRMTLGYREARIAADCALGPAGARLARPRIPLCDHRRGRRRRPLRLCSRRLRRAGSARRLAPGPRHRLILSCDRRGVRPRVDRSALASYEAFKTRIGLPSRNASAFSTLADRIRARSQPRHSQDAASAPYGLSPQRMIRRQRLLSKTSSAAMIVPPRQPRSAQLRQSAGHAKC